MMKLLFALTFLLTLRSSAGALQCLACTNASDATCASTASFPCATSECLTATASPGPVTVRYCGLSGLCPAAVNQTFSVSSTVFTFSLNASCCNTNNCNVATLNAPTFQSVNSLQCYSCDTTNLNCSIQIQCTGGQNRCFQSNATVGGVTLPVRGCVSSNLCTAASNLSSLAASFNLSGLGTTSPLSSLGSFPGLSSISCCQGSLCNSAPAVATTTHLLLALLVFSLYR